MLFCVAQDGDPVVPLVRRLIESHPSIPARLVIGNDRISDNPKLNNVVKGWNAAVHPWIVMADSNVVMPPDYLDELFATWRADTGLVSSPAIGSRPEGIWAELECAFLNTYQARWQCSADEIGMGFAQGKSMLYRRDLIEAAGGIRALACELAEDAASTKIVRQQGLRVRVVDRPFKQPLGFRTAAQVWHRQLRWARLRRDTFVLYFLPEIFSGGIPAAGGLRDHRRRQRRAGRSDARGLCDALVRPRSAACRICRLAPVVALADRLDDARPADPGAVVHELARQRLRLARQRHAGRRPRFARA